MKYFKPLLFTAFILVAVFALSSCDGDKDSAPTYTVMVPQFAEGNNKDAKAGIDITIDKMGDESFVKRFFAYRLAPPITGFTPQKIAHGSKINTSLFGNPITLTMTVASNGDYLFKGSNEDEYIEVTISKDNKSFSYTHALILEIVGSIPGAEDEFDVVVGEGEILSANHFDSHGTAYYLSASRVAEYKFLLHGKEGGKMAWLCYDGVLKDVSGVVNFDNASNYKTNCIDVVDGRIAGSRNMYYAMFDKDGMFFESIVNPSGYGSEEAYYNAVLASNGIGPAYSPTVYSYDTICEIITSNNGIWSGFNNWDIAASVAKWEIVLNLETPT